MDPSRYARVFGVQSESNKVTVTRVASNEIVYRRAVDTYRRDMTSKMTSLHREQKKLKRNMRGYRRKLRGAQNLPVKKRKPFKMGWIAYDTETSFYDMATVPDKHKSDRDNKQFPSSKLQSQVDVFLKSVDEHVHNMSVGKQDVIEEEESNEILYDKNGRRRFLFGSGGIGASSDALKGLELELEGYHFHGNDHFSDTSSECGGNQDGGKKSARNDSRKKCAMELVRLNSAYFTPIDLKKDDIDPANSESVLEDPTNYDNEVIKGTSNIDVKNIKSAANEETNNGLPSISVDYAIKPSGKSEERKSALLFSNAISSVVQAVKEKNEKENVFGQNQSRTQPHELSGRKSNKVNFGDLIKFKHGVNTKKLFSLVDQMASKYGVSSKEHENARGNKRQEAPNTSRSRNNNLEPIDESDSKSSIFYAIKYGYGKSVGQLPKDEYKLGEVPDKANHTSEHQHNEYNFGDKIHREMGESLHIDSLKAANQHDMVDGSVISSGRIERRNELPFLQVSSPASMIRQNLDGKETSRSGNITTPLNPQSFRSHEDSVRKNRSSILDASNYVSNLRRRVIVQEHDKMFGIKNDSERFGPRRMPAALRKEPGISEHQRKADDKKITWSSALGQMKLVHTLQDLTHFI